MVMIQKASKFVVNKIGQVDTLELSYYNKNQCTYNATDF